LGVSHAFELPSTGPLTARFDIINVVDTVYQIGSAEDPSGDCVEVLTR